MDYTSSFSVDHPPLTFPGRRNQARQTKTKSKYIGLSTVYNCTVVVAYWTTTIASTLITDEHSPTAKKQARQTDKKRKYIGLSMRVEYYTTVAYWTTA